MWRLFTVRIKFAFPNRSHLYIIYSFTYTYFHVLCNTPQLAIQCNSHWGCEHVHFCGSDVCRNVQCDQREADVNSDRARRVADLRGRWSDGKKTLGAPGSLVINTIVCHLQCQALGSHLFSRYCLSDICLQGWASGVVSGTLVFFPPSFPYFSKSSQGSMPFRVVWVCLRLCEVRTKTSLGASHHNVKVRGGRSILDISSGFSSRRDFCFFFKIETWARREILGLENLERRGCQLASWKFQESELILLVRGRNFMPRSAGDVKVR